MDLPKISLPFTRSKRLQIAGIALSLFLVFLLARILKTRREVSTATSNLSPNLAAFLAVIRFCEGTSGPDGYRTMFTGKLFSSYDHHPNRVNVSGKLRSSAAGAYQFLYSTWLECKALLGLPDFSPQSQDEAAVYLIRKRGALEDIESGRLTAAVYKCAKEWASFPTSTGSSYYGGQPSKSLSAIHQKFRSEGGQIVS